MIREIAVPLCSGTPALRQPAPDRARRGVARPPDDPVFSHDDDIYLEVTESAPMTHFELCVNVLREVCGRAGVHLVIDDLGAGYSNLNLIADLEPRVVKLDRKLVQDLHRKPRQQKVVAMVVRLCEELGATVVAEGIETRDEFRAVCDSGAQYGQGYLFARPASPSRPSSGRPSTRASRPRRGQPAADRTHLPGEIPWRTRPRTARGRARPRAGRGAVLS